MHQLKDAGNDDHVFKRELLQCSFARSPSSPRTASTLSAGLKVTN
jgi:hypothetical protein